MKKYPLGGAEKSRYMAGQGKGLEGPKAVQPEALQGILERGADA
jgi:hypothetical protein